MGIYKKAPSKKKGQQVTDWITGMYPGDKVQVDVKCVPRECMTRELIEKGERFYQYTAIDEYTRLRYTWFTNEQISCTGCKEDNWCRYNVIKCTADKHIKHCGQCLKFPCDNIRECFKVTKSFEPFCKRVCTEDEYSLMRKAFFEKEKNLRANLN